MRENLLIFTSILLFIQGYLFVNILPSLLGLGIALFLLSLKLSFNPKLKVDIEISKKDITQDEEAVFVFNITNNSKVPVKIKIMPCESNFKWNVSNTILKSGEKKEINIKLKPKKRGTFNIKEFILKVYDIFEIYDKDIITKKEFVINVYPSIKNIKRDIIVDKNVDISNELLNALKLGVLSSEIDHLREFQTGDNIKHIDWKATARSGKLIIREFLREYNNDTYILVDISKDFIREVSKEKSKINYLSLLVSQLVYFLIEKDINVEAIFFDNLKIKKILKNPTNVKKITEEIKPVRGLPTLSVSLDKKLNSKFLKTISSLIKGSSSGLVLSADKAVSNSSVIIITDAGLRGNELIEVINNLKKKNIKVYVLSLNPILFIEEDRLNFELIPKVYKRFKEREDLIKKIRFLCPILDLGPKDIIRNFGGKNGKNHKTN